MVEGMTKTYRLTYESAEVMHALFDKTAASQGWRISARIMREYIEYFGPKTEQLDLCATDGKVIFTSFTEKIQDGKEVLKQPMETVITLHTDDFEDFHMQANVHITINVKDFKAIVTHAETLHTPISAFFSYPTRPLQFSYQNEGMNCSFTLMTIGDYRGASATPNPNFVSTRSASRQPSMVPAPVQSRNTSEMPPPARPASRMNTDKPPLSSQSQRGPLRPESHHMLAPAPEPDDDSLFMPAGDDDERRWDPPNFDNDPEEEEMLGWDASNEMRGTEPHPTFRDSGRSTQPSRQERQPQQTPSEWEDGLEPTQRLSQVRLIMIWHESSVANMNTASWNVRLMALLSRLVRPIAYEIRGVPRVCHHQSLEIWLARVPKASLRAVSHPDVFIALRLQVVLRVKQWITGLSRSQGAAKRVVLWNQ